MRKSYIEKVLNNTQVAAEQWNDFATECEDMEAFRNAFHLRPKSNGVTIVSTLGIKPMRGAHSAKTKVAQFLKELYEKELHLESSDETIIYEKKELLKYKKFEDRKKPKEKKAEETYQAKMIKSMSINKELKSFLNVKELYFIASEFILHPQSDASNRERVDIIGYDGLDKIFFFELKTPENTKDKPDEQVVKYLNRYSNDRREETIDVLSNYPINSIKTRDVKFHGYAVYGYSKEIDKATSKPFKNIKQPGIIRFIC
jgi:hypothetical protein